MRKLGIKLFAVALVAVPLMGGAAVVYGATEYISSCVKPLNEGSWEPDSGSRVFRSEGKVILSPVGGPSAETPGLYPDVLSITLADESVAREMYEETVANGERACLVDLGPQVDGDYRWWLRSC